MSEVTINMQNEKITYVTSKRGLLNINLSELWSYRDLALLLVKRDLVNSYKQTVLGPIWIIINPLLSTMVFTVIFGVIACLNRASSTFLGNARLFGKVYFPRLIMPVAGILYNLVNFLLQTAVYVILVVVYSLCGANVHPNALIALAPLLIIQTALLGTGMGLIISSITTKYRDLNILVSFGVSLLMYITPVVYPISQVPEKFRWIMLLNPVAPIVETYRYSFLGSGSIEWLFLGISFAATIIILSIGIVVFNQVEKNFIDTV